MATRATPRTDAPGHVSADSLNTLSKVQHRLNRADRAMWQARPVGLRVRRVGRPGLILGRDLMEFTAKAAK